MTAPADGLFVQNHPNDRVVTLADILSTIETGRRPRGGASDDSSGVLSLGGEHVAANGSINLKQPRFVSEEFFKELNAGRIQPRDILIVKDGATTGKVGQVPAAPPFERAAINEHLFLVRSDESACLQDYLYFILSSPAGYAMIRRDFRGSAQGGISKDFIHLVRFRLPPLEEQRRIVDILDRAASIRRLRRQAQETARQIIPALFVKMFGDPATNPIGWASVPLSSVARVGSGSGFPIRYQGLRSGKLPFYKVSDMNSRRNSVRMSLANNFISEEVRLELRATVFPAGTVIFPKIGAAIATNKKRLLTVDACVDNNVMGISPGPGLRPAFLHALLGMKNISEFASDSNPPSIRKSTVESWELPLPPLGLQEEFEERVAVLTRISDRQASAATVEDMALRAIQARLLG